MKFVFFFLLVWSCWPYFIIYIHKAFLSLTSPSYRAVFTSVHLRYTTFLSSVFLCEVGQKAEVILQALKGIRDVCMWKVRAALQRLLFSSSRLLVLLVLHCLICFLHTSAINFITLLPYLSLSLHLLLIFNWVSCYFLPIGLRSFYTSLTWHL